MKHPNLFFSYDDVENYKIKIQTDEAAAARYKAAVKDAEDCLDEELVSWEKAEGGTGQHADFGLVNHQANRFCSVLGTKYLVEGDVRCAEKIKQMLLHFTGFERWHSVNYLNRTPVPWHSDLCSTAATLALSSAFDVIYGYLTAEERRTIAAGILEKGVIPAFSDWVLPESRIHALDSMGHNWWSVCIAEPATALLALQDEFPEESERLLKLADGALTDYLTYKGNKLFNKLGNFDGQGLFYESIAYNNYGTGTLLRYLWCRERYSGRNEQLRNAVPQELTDSLMCFSYPVGTDGGIRYDFLNFGDSDVRAEYSVIMKYAFRLGIASDAVKACLAGYAPDIREEIGGLCLENLSGTTDALPLTKVFSSGYAVSRTSFEPDSTLFAVKCGFCWNHSHNDSGTFVIFHRGKPFFIDGGTCRYDSPLYHSYYCQDCAHSVLRIGGEGRRDEELYRGTKFPGELTDSFISRDYFFVQADSTGPMAHLCSRMFRNFFWIDGRLLVIFDDVFCHRENSVEFTVHPDAEFYPDGSTVVFDNGTSKARLVTHLPETEYSVGHGHPDHRENEDMPYAVLTAKEKKRTHLLINSLELDPDENPYSISLLEGENADGLSVENGETVREIWFNRMADGHIMHDNSNNVISGFDTDAYMLLITKSKAGNGTRVLAVCASYLRKDGKVLMSSFVKKTEEIEL